MARSTVQLRDMCKSFGSTRVINHVDLDIAPGEFVVFVGPSGCGKSTLLRLIAGLERPDAGRITIGQADVTEVHPAERGVAMVFQSYALYPHMSVADNMGFGLRIRGEAKAAIRSKVQQAAEILQLTHLLERKPRELSGGQRQRVAIGRAIVREPDVFLFDEPLSNLDASLRGQMRIELARLHAQLAATMIYVTHDQVEAMTLADKIVVLNGGQVEQVGSPLELYHRPANRFVAGFLGSPQMNFLPARLHTQTEQTIRVSLPLGELELRRNATRALGDEALSIGVRPEDLCLVGTHEPAIVAGQVSLVERLGGEALVHVQCDALAGGSLVLKLAGDAPAAARDTVRLGVRADSCHLFDHGGQAIGTRP